MLVKIKTDVGFAILIDELPMCFWPECSRPIDMDQHSIKNMKKLADRLDAVNKAYADRIKYKISTGNISNTVTTDHTIFTFPAAKSVASGKIKICEMWVERLADEWIATSSPNSQLSGLVSQVLKRSVPYDILHQFPC